METIGLISKNYSTKYYKPSTRKETGKLYLYENGQIIFDPKNNPRNRINLDINDIRTFQFTPLWGFFGWVTIVTKHKQIFRFNGRNSKKIYKHLILMKKKC